MVSPCNDTEHPVNCGEGGICAVKDGTTAVCICGEGYHLEVGGSLTECKPDDVVVSPCNDTEHPVDCGTGGVCAVRTSTDATIDNTAICICAEGYHVTTTNLTECVADPFSKCDDPNQDGNKDDKVTCSNHGICAVDPADDSPKCICNPGYHQSATDATICELDENPCDAAGIDCGTNGECVVQPSAVPGEAGTAVCICGPGFKQNASNPAQCMNICDGVDCGPGGSCVVNPDDDTPLCLCGEGYHQNETVVTQCDLDTDYCNDPTHPVTCNGDGTCVNAKDGAVCLCNEGFHATVADPTNCVEDVLPNPCDGVTCNDKGYCLISYPNNAQCVCETGFSNRLPTECIESGADNNGNYMLDIYETASDQGKDCFEDRNSCTNFCDSFMDYKCSTKCTDDTQCTDGYVCRTDGRCAPQVFESVWYAKSANATINFPTLAVFNSETYDCDFNIDWGDGNTSHVTDCNNYVTSHKYNNTAARSYTIKVTGKMAFACIVSIISNTQRCGESNAVYLTEVKSFGPVVLLADAFHNANKLAKVSAVDIPIIGDDEHSMKSMFEVASIFKDQAGMLNKWDTSGVTDMSSAFAQATTFNSAINHWDTSSVTNMNNMFNSATVFNQELNDWDTSSVMNMKRMFYSAPSFDQPLNNWNTSKVKDMSEMFMGAEAFNQNINDWDTSSVTDMSNMFMGTVFNQPLSNWDTHNVTNMSGMFWGAKAFNQPLTTNGNKWNTSNVTDMSLMFAITEAFDQDINSWDTSSVTNMQGMFMNALVFNHSLSNWDTHNVTDMRIMFYGAKAFNQPLTTNGNKWNVSNVTTMLRMFKGAVLFDQDLNSWDTSSVTDMQEMFKDAAEFHHSLENWKVTQVTSYSDMFLNTIITKSQWQTMKANTSSGWADKDFSQLGLPASHNE